VERRYVEYIDDVKGEALGVVYEWTHSTVICLVIECGDLVGWHRGLSPCFQPTDQFTVSF